MSKARDQLSMRLVYMNCSYLMHGGAGVFVFVEGKGALA
jgi:hypothetical protein